MLLPSKNPFEADASEIHRKDKRILDWEESAIDDEADVEEFSEQARTFSVPTWLKPVLILSAIILFTQLFNLQIIQGEKLKDLAEGNRIRIQTIMAPRGYIVDRYGKQLARNTASFSLVATPADIPTDGLATIEQRLSELFNIPLNEIQDKLKNLDSHSIQQIVIKRGLTQQDSILFATQADHFAGFSIKSIPIREYLEAEIFSHILGYTGAISDTELGMNASENYDPNDLIGKSGIELADEKFLRGTNGNTQVEVDASGRPIKVLGNVAPKPGNIVELNIDSELQQEIYNSFPKGSKGAAVALNPKTGEVLALVSVPGFNNNLFASGISTTDYQTLLQDKNLPLFNRAISGTYPPGSTIKLVTAAAALQEHVVTKNTIINDNGVLVINNQFNPSIKYYFVGWKRSGLGPMNVKDAIAESSDIYFYTVAGGHPSSNINGLGAEKLAEYYRRFGMGSVTGIDIQGERTGVVADPAWKANYFQNDPITSKWYLGDTYHISIGQGDMLATPLQVASWTATIANNGTFNKPRLLKDVKDQSGTVVYEPKPEILINSGVSLDNIKSVQEGMRENVIGAKGSGRQLATLPISSAGKTGTSQFDGADLSRTHAWFTSYAPYENPEIVVTVLVEAGGEGHAAALPIAKNALKWWAEHRYNK